MQELLGSEVEKAEEHYNFTWHGKRAALRFALKKSTGTLRPVKGESVDWDNTQNVFIEGDNLEVLKLLQKSYFGKVKMIYIDPPYNTGNDFVYADDFKDGVSHYLDMIGMLDKEGKRNSTKANPSKAGRYHTDWLNMMYPRLRLARNLLKDDGVIFISIDDHEQANLKKLCDEIFRRENFLCSFIWKTRQASGKQVAENNISVEHEYLLAYSKTSQSRFSGVERDKTTYKNSDNDPRGDWAKHPLDVGSTSIERPNCFYTITDPETSNKYKANPNRVWAFAPQSMENLLLEGKIIFDPNGKNKPYLKKFWSELKSKKKPITTWLSREAFNIGFNTEGTKIVNKLFDNQKLFDYPSLFHY